MNDNNGNSDEIKYCSICHRSEHDRQLDLPNGGHICPDCLQSMMNAVGSINYSDLMKDLMNGKIPEMPAPDKEQTPSSDEEKKDGGDERKFYGDDSTKDDDKKNPDRGPTVSFLNLGDIFGGGGQRQQKVKKKKKTGPKPVFTYDNIPAPHLTING